MSSKYALKAGATYDDLRAVPENMVAEILGGELFAFPRPALPHAYTMSVLGGDLVGRFQRGQPGGWWILDEPELHFGTDVLVPDIAGWRRERLASVPRAPYLDLAPDWICEIVSPSTEAVDRSLKLAIYARENIPHAWLVNPIAQTLEVLRLAVGRWTPIVTHEGRAMIRAEPFDAVELELGALWSE